MKKILIAGRVADTVAHERSLLNRGNFKVFTAASGEETLEIHRRERVDLIVMGTDLAGMPCDELCALIRGDDLYKHVSIMMVGSDSDADRQLASRCKANAFVTKPLRPAPFLEEVSRFLDIPTRKSYRVLLKIAVEGKFNNESFFCSSQNISVSGVLIETTKVLEKNDAITCSFFLPGAGQIAVAGEVMRVVPCKDAFQYGIRFTNLTASHRSAIEDLVRARLR